MNDIHQLINELGAEIEDSDRYDAMMILNNLYQSGISDLWICIALGRILKKGSFYQWKYLLQYDEFVKENDYLEKVFLNTSLRDKLNEIDCAIGFNRDIDISDDEIDYLNENYIYPSLDNELDYEEVKEEIEYYYLKYYFIDSCPYTLKYLFRETH